MVILSVEDTDYHQKSFTQYAKGYWRRAAVVSWTVSLTAGTIIYIHIDVRVIS